MPVELITGQGFGDLFVIRVAGNIAEPSQIGSVEFAVQTFGTRLIVVLGHSDCGAINATVDALLDGAEAPSPALGSIVDRIRPVVEPLVERYRSDRAELVGQAVRANITATVQRLREQSQLLAPDDVRIVGAEYTLGTGVVTYFED